MILSALLMITAMLSPQGSSYRERFPFPGESVPDGWGVCMHLSNWEDGDSSKIAAAGFKLIRTDLAWSNVEKKPGVYGFGRYDQLMSELERNGLRAMFILDYGNKLYGPDSPRSPEQIQAFIDFTMKALDRYHGRGVIWELWNEPNIKYWVPQPNPEEYSRWAMAVAKAIRAKYPDEWIIAPGLNRFDLAYLEPVMKSGILNYIDGVSIHPYRHQDPETVKADWDAVRSLVHQYGPSGKDIHLVCSEWGYSLAYKELNPQIQAEYAVRQYLSNLADGVPITMWYEWRDADDRPKDIKSNFGLLYRDSSAKPVLNAIAAAATALKGYKFESRPSLGRDQDYGLIFKNGTKRMLVAWTTDPEDREVNIPVSIGYFTQIGNGRRISLTRKVQMYQGQ